MAWGKRLKVPWRRKGGTIEKRGFGAVCPCSVPSASLRSQDQGNYLPLYAKNWTPNRSLACRRTTSRQTQPTAVNAEMAIPKFLRGIKSILIDIYGTMRYEVFNMRIPCAHPLGEMGYILPLLDGRAVVEGAKELQSQLQKRDPEANETQNILQEV